MWLCEKCNHKNNNSSERCHGLNCNEKRSYIFTQEHVENKERVLDTCPKCRKETIFTFKRSKGKKKIFVCNECGKSCFQVGKSKPVPEEMIPI